MGGMSPVLAYLRRDHDLVGRVVPLTLPSEIHPGGGAGVKNISFMVVFKLFFFEITRNDCLSGGPGRRSGQEYIIHGSIQTFFFEITRNDCLSGGPVRRSGQEYIIHGSRM